MKYIVEKESKGYITEIDYENIRTTYDYNKIIYFEQKEDATNLAKFLNDFDEFEKYEVKEISIN